MIKELIETLRTIDETTWGLYTFKRDPLHNKLSYEEKIEKIEKANQCGREEAIKLKAKYGSDSCRQYAEKLGLEISNIEEQNTDDYILFAKFNSPNKISLCDNNIKSAEEMVSRENMEELIDRVKIEEVLIAHEMFHFVEGSRKDIYTKTEKVRLWKLGPIKYDSGLIALGEIAAIAFAKELLGLTYYPNVFDVLLIYPHDEKRAKILYEEVTKLKGNDYNA